jgi:NADPH-dependent 2,4-dienoyl-CoA reductase/sulfur reductase-like enzyme/rhodanese-related sulfurtransferase
MGLKVLIVGAVALGPKVACRVKRLLPSADITIFEKEDRFSYGGCGIPYYVSGDVPNIEGLCSTSSHAIRDDVFFKKAKGITVRSKTEAVTIDRKNKTLTVRDQHTDAVTTIPYDKLVIATGGTPVVPPIPGADLPGVSMVSNLSHAEKIKARIAKGSVRRAVVIGGGAIGLEMAEALADMWEVETTLVEMVDQLLPQAIGPDMSRLVRNHMTAKGVEIRVSDSVTRIIGSRETGVTAVETKETRIPCDLVIMAVGVRPNSSLAVEAGLATGSYGGIIVDECLQTTDPNIYAGGDCIEMRHQVSGQRVPMPLGSLANRQGRVIGTNIAGGHDRFTGTVGTFCLKVFDIAVATAGLTTAQAKLAGFDPVHSVVAGPDHAHFYQNPQIMYLKLIADRQSRRVLGIEAVGPNGDALKSRVDAVAALLPCAVDVSAISNLEVAYAPPFASAMDIVNNAANTLDNIIMGYNEPVDVATFVADFSAKRTNVLDVRGKTESLPFIDKYGAQWINIPQAELADRIAELPVEKPICLICDTGPRSYESQLILKANGISNSKNVQGGYGMLSRSNPDF